MVVAMAAEARRCQVVLAPHSEQMQRESVQSSSSSSYRFGNWSCRVSASRCRSTASGMRHRGGYPRRRSNAQP